MNWKQAPVIILHRYVFQDSSLILKCISEDGYYVSLLAKGAKRPKSPFRGQMEVFTQGEAGYREKPGRDMHPLENWAVLKSPYPLMHDVVKFAYAQFWSEILMKLGRHGAYAPGVFEFTRDYVLKLEAAVKPESISTLNTLFLLNLLRLCGVGISFEVCSRCGAAMNIPAAVMWREGWVVCANCTPVQSEHADVLKLWKDIDQDADIFIPPEQAKKSEDLLSLLYESHLSVNIKSKSKNYLDNVRSL